MAASMRESYGKALAEYGAVNRDVVVLDADTASSTQTCLFADRFPDRFFNLGIAEPGMVDVGVGLSLAGKIPFVNAFAALLALRAVEQIRTCVAYARTNVKLVGGYAGISDFKDGPTHHAITDIAMMRALPELTVIAPADARETGLWVPLLAEYDGPVYMRISRAATLDVHKTDIPLQIGKAIILREGHDLSILCLGSMVGRSLLAAEQMSAQGIEARVIEVPTVKPLDLELIHAAAAETGALVTAEEHSIIGGLGGAVAEVLGERCPTPLQRVGIKDVFARTALTAEALMDAYGLGVEDVVRAAHAVLRRKEDPR